MPESTTFWIAQLKEGNRDAAQELWERYYRRLVSLARKRLSGRYFSAASDENDVAQSAFASFYDAAEKGRFPQLSDSGDLWRLLITITQRKVTRRLRYQNSQKRTPLNRAENGHEVDADLDSLPSNEPTPDFCVETIESLRNLIARLNDPTLQAIALLKMEGYTNDEIAARRKCSLSTVERKVRLIRLEWSNISEEQE